MAKLKGPLFSLGASGAIGEAVVYFPWKGLNVAREYVVPSNPNTSLQQTQRGYLKTMVKNVHDAEAWAAHPLNELDKSAYALLGSTYPTPRTWFNTAIKIGIDQLRAVAGRGILCAGDYDVHAASIDAMMYYSASPPITAGTFFYGTSKTALINSVAAIIELTLQIWATLPGLASKTKYYWQFKATTPPAQVGLVSGIYFATTP